MFGVWRKDFRQGCQNCILIVQRNVLEEKNVMKKNYSFINFSEFAQKKNFRTFSENFSWGLWKLHSTSPYEPFGAFEKNVNMLSPSWQIPEKKFNPLRERIFLS